jgi:hypothetical protein
MNGKAAKRIRLAARTITAKKVPQDYRRMYRQLKRAYKQLPYHLRPIPKTLRKYRALTTHRKVLHQHYAGTLQEGTT